MPLNVNARHDDGMKGTRRFTNVELKESHDARRFYKKGSSGVNASSEK